MFGLAPPSPRVTFSLPPGVRGWLRLLLVAVPGLFCLPFSSGNQTSRINKFIPPQMCKMDEWDTKLEFESVISISCTIVC